MLILFLVAACAAPQRGRPVLAQASGAQPVEAVLYADILTVEMSDGSLCAVLRPGGAVQARTDLAGCPSAYPVAVTWPADMPARLPLARGAAPTLVTLTTPEGPIAFGPGAS